MVRILYCDAWRLRPMLIHNIAKIKLQFWISWILLFLIVFRTIPADDVCKQQAQSSFQLRKLGHASSDTKCNSLCCSDDKCDIALRKRRHCYAIKCVRKDICQLVYEQLKHFEGHRVDKRDNDREGEEEFDWDAADTLASTGLTQMLKSKNAEETQTDGTTLNGTNTEGDNFPAFLIVGSKSQQDLDHLEKGTNNQLHSMKEMQNDSDIPITNNYIVNRIFRAISGDSGHDDHALQMGKRSTDDDDDDDDDEQDYCVEGSFHKSIIPTRRKNYKYKRLIKKSQSIGSCSKKCCKVEDCVLSFLVEKRCYGIICAGDGNCHIKKDRLPKMEIKVALVEKHAKKSIPTKRTAEDIDNSQKRHKVINNNEKHEIKHYHYKKKKNEHRKKKSEEKEEDDDIDDSQNGNKYNEQNGRKNVDDNDKDIKRKDKKQTKAKKVEVTEHTPDHHKRSHKKKTKSEEYGDEDGESDDSTGNFKDVDDEATKGDNKIAKKKRKKEKHKNFHEEIYEKYDDASEQRQKHVMEPHHKKTQQQLSEDGAENGEKMSHLKDRGTGNARDSNVDNLSENRHEHSRKSSIATDQYSDESLKNTGDAGEHAKRHTMKHHYQKPKQQLSEESPAENAEKISYFTDRGNGNARDSNVDDLSENGHEHGRKSSIATDLYSEESLQISGDPNEDEKTHTTKPYLKKTQQHISSKEQVGNGEEFSQFKDKGNESARDTDADDVPENSHEHSRKSNIATDEYSDDVKHLLYDHKAANEKLFDDEVVGYKKGDGNDQDGAVGNGEDEDGQTPKGEEVTEENEVREYEKLPSETVGNEKVNDLMIDHRHYADHDESEIGKGELKLDKIAEEVGEDESEQNVERPTAKREDLEVAGEGLENYHDKREGKNQDNSESDQYHNGSERRRQRTKKNYHHLHQKGTSQFDQKETANHKQEHAKAEKYSYFQSGSGEASGQKHYHKKVLVNKKAHKSESYHGTSKRRQSRKKSKRKHHPSSKPKGLQREEKLLDKLESLEEKLELKQMHKSKKKKHKHSHKGRKSKPLLHHKIDKHRGKANSYRESHGAKHTAHHRYHQKVNINSENLNEDKYADEDDESRRFESEENHEMEKHYWPHVRHEIIVPYLERHRHSHRHKYNDHLDKEDKSNQYDISRYEKDKINIPTDEEQIKLKKHVKGSAKEEDVRVFISDRKGKVHPHIHHSVQNDGHSVKRSKTEEGIRYGHKEDIFKEFLEYKKKQEEIIKQSSEHSGEGSGHLQYSGQEILKHVKGGLPAKHSHHKEGIPKEKQKHVLSGKHHHAKKKEGLTKITKEGKSLSESSDQNKKYSSGKIATVSAVDNSERNTTGNRVPLDAFYGKKPGSTENVIEVPRPPSITDRNITNIIPVTSVSTIPTSSTTVLIKTTKTTIVSPTYTTTHSTTTESTTVTTGRKQETISTIISNKVNKQPAAIPTRAAKTAGKKKLKSVSIQTTPIRPLPKVKTSHNRRPTQKPIITKPTETTVNITPIPTLSIMTGDEDVQIVKVPLKKHKQAKPEQPVKPVQSHKPNLKHHVESKGIPQIKGGQPKKTKLKAPASPKKFQKAKQHNNHHEVKHMKRVRPTVPQHLTYKADQKGPRTYKNNPTSSHVTIASHLKGWVPQPGLQSNKGSSAGELGDLQLPEPSELINNIPMRRLTPNGALSFPQINQEPLEVNQHNQANSQNYIHRMPIPPFQRYGIAQRITQSPNHVLTTKAPSLDPQHLYFNGELPFQNRDKMPPPEVSPEPYPLTPTFHPLFPLTRPTADHKFPLSPLQIIDRILNRPKPTAATQLNRPTRPPSPMKVIERILGGQTGGKPSIRLITNPTKPARLNKPLKQKQRPMQRKPELSNKPLTSKPTSQLNNNANLKKFFNAIEQATTQRPTNRQGTSQHQSTKIPTTTMTTKQTTRQQTTKISTTTMTTTRQPQCTVTDTLANFVLINGRQSGEFTRLPGYPDTPTCIRQCCNTPTCDVVFKSGEVCYLVHCHTPQSCKTVPSGEPLIRTKIVRISRPLVIKPVSAIYDSCPSENAFGISWKQTQANQFAAKSCPRDATGSARRKCDNHSRWYQPDFSNCVSIDYRDVHEKLNNLGSTTSIKEICSRLEDITTQTIDNSLIFGGDLIKATGVLESLAAYAINTNREKIGFRALRNFARSASNLLDETNKQEWENIREIIKGPSQIMRALEKFGIFAASQLPTATLWKPVITNNFVMSVARLSNIKKYTFPNYSIPILRTWTTKRDSITLPGSLFSGGVVKVASMNYKTLAHLLPHPWNITNHITFTDGFRVNSKVIASSVHPRPDKKINPPVTIILHHIKEINSARTKCVFWDFNLNREHGGSWSSDGCWTVMSNATVTICQCDHLTHFAVLMHLSDERVSAKEQDRENTMALMWLGIPILVVVMVGAMYTCFAWSKAPRRRHVVIMDGKPKLPDNETIITKTVKENFPSSPNRLLYSSYNSPSPSDLEWEHAWDFLTNSEYENWKEEVKPKIRKLISPKKRLEKKRAKKAKEIKAKQSKDPLQTSEYYSDPDSISFYRWKHQDDYEWSKERIKCLGKGIVDVSSESSQPVDSLEEFSDDPSVGDPRAEDKSHSFDSFSPDAISSPRSGCYNELAPKRHSYLFKTTLKDTRHYLQLSFGDESDINSDIRSFRSKYASCSSINTMRPANRYSSWSSINSIKSTQNLRRIQSLDTLLETINSKYESLTSLNTLGKLIQQGTDHKMWQVRYGIGASYSSFGRTSSSGFLDHTWSSKYASSLSIGTMDRTNSVRTIHEDFDEKDDPVDLTECNEQHSIRMACNKLDVNIPTDIDDMNLLTSLHAPEKGSYAGECDSGNDSGDNIIEKNDASLITYMDITAGRNYVSSCDNESKIDNSNTPTHENNLLRSLPTFKIDCPTVLYNDKNHLEDKNIPVCDINLLSVDWAPSRNCLTPSNSCSSLSQDSEYNVDDLSMSASRTTLFCKLDVSDSVCCNDNRNITELKSPVNVDTMEEIVKLQIKDVEKETIQSQFIEDTSEKVQTKSDVKTDKIIYDIKIPDQTLFPASEQNDINKGFNEPEHSMSSVFDSESRVLDSDENSNCSCPSSSKTLKTHPKKRKSKIPQSKIRRKILPKNENVNPNSSLRDKKSTTKQVKAGSSSVTRSPTKNMRSYIALRQQSRCSDQEKQCYSTHDEEDKVVNKKRKFKYRKTKNKTTSSIYMSDGMSSGNDQNLNCKKSVLRRTASLSKISRPKLNRKDLKITREGSQIIEHKSKIPRRAIHSSSSRVKRQVIEEIRRSMENKVFAHNLKRWKGTSKLHPKETIVDIEF